MTKVNLCLASLDEILLIVLKINSLQTVAKYLYIFCANHRMFAALTITIITDKMLSAHC